MLNSSKKMPYFVFFPLLSALPVLSEIAFIEVLKSLTNRCFVPLQEPNFFGVKVCLFAIKSTFTIKRGILMTKLPYTPSGEVSIGFNSLIFACLS